MERATSTIAAVPMGSTFSCPTCWQLSRMSGVKLGDDGLLSARCAACGTKISANAQVLAASGCGPVAQSGAVAANRPKDPFSAPKGTCPECLAPHPEKDRSCSVCQLDFDTFKRASVQPSKTLAGAWREVVFRWSENEQHERFQRLAVDRNELTAAHRLYTLWLAYLPRDPWALKWREDLELLSKIAADAREGRRPNRLSLRVAVGLGWASFMTTLHSLPSLCRAK